MSILRSTLPRIAILALAAGLLAHAGGCTAERMTQVIADDIVILRSFQTADAIPRERLREAKAVAIIRETKGAAVVGASGGEGVLLKRLDGGKWSPPLAIEMSSGSFGLQIGGESREIVLLFFASSAVDRMLATGTFATGRAEGSFGDAFGRVPGSLPDQDVEAYVRLGGLFGGLSVNALGFGPSNKLNTATYGSTWTVRRVLNGEVETPAGAMTLWKMLNEMER
ncbi:MAG TPA: lipid-binding SYLF domain-containing protein [Phycisphaerales bacterium]|nr:lipid-binding SYLF domain-containing protein [Phycisphaerales bacterium]HMP38614.1 lipid-binding SYLF domain-containing protein [Phycisphaerales bacterium]